VQQRFEDSAGDSHCLDQEDHAPARAVREKKGMTKENVETEEKQKQGEERERGLEASQ